ncbi:retinol dehydrogenase 14-like [Galendromus occidentalis]|uniref:Retinol dehydrogenase 14-like n=1 Tax=Galendromus occidentalis TaxID=34638 RepID=A0AAJ7SEM2_9ACAR|nr:retinol dehydrogenase 14-like [Galendromus occidentalis]
MIWIALLLVVNVLVVFFFLYMRRSVLCPVDADMHGKVVVITGGNSGIGLEAAKELARRRAHVIIACRSKERAEDAVLEVIRETKWSNVRSVKLDLSSFKSVRECANNLLQSEDRIDVLINNAAGLPYGGNVLLTEDKIEYQYQTNFYGHFLLTSLLLPALLKSDSPRLVNVSSCLYKLGRIDLENYDQSKYRELGMQVYSNTKLAIVMITRELAERFGHRGLGAFSCTPGTCNTNIARNVPWYIRYTVGQVSRIFSRSANDGAQTIVYLAVDPSLSNGALNGKYFIDCEVEPLLASALDEATSAKLFAFSEKLTGADYSII